MINIFDQVLVKPPVGFPFTIVIDSVKCVDGVNLLYGRTLRNNQEVYAVHPRYCEVYDSFRVEIDQKECGSLKIENKEPIESDGKSSSYYDLKLNQKTIDFIKENGYVKTEMLIYDIFDNDFDFSNAFKSLVRAWGTVNGAGKKGNSLNYELNKIEYSVNKIREYRSKEIKED